MRIAIVQFVHHYGGGIRTLVDLAAKASDYAAISVVDPYGCDPAYEEAVREAGLDYHVLYPEARRSYIGGRDAGPVVRAVRLLQSGPNLLKVRARTKALIRKLDPSCLCTCDFKTGMTLASIPCLRHIPLVFYLQGWLPFTPQQMPWYGKWLCRRRHTAVLAVSHATKGALICSGVPQQKISVLHNWLDVDEITASSNRPLEAPLPQAQRPVRILLPAGIMRAKGQHTAVRAMRWILDAGHDAVLWIAGDHQPIGANKHYLEETQAQAQQLGVGDRVEWLGLRGDIPQIMNAATIVILPSHTEGHPRVILEAMGLGKPVAATPVGGIRDMILPEMTGLFFDVDDSHGLAECVTRFANDPEAASRMGRHARQYVLRCFRPDRQIDKAMEVFRGATATRSPA